MGPPGGDGHTSLQGARDSSTWLPYLPRHVAEEILGAPGLDPVAREQRFRAAVLFADISGFTSISEAFARTGDLGTEELTELLNGYFGAMISLIESFGGSVAKFGGDSVTALFPAARRERAATRRAIQCALDMQELMPRYGSISTAAGTFGLTFKAGLSLGDVLATTVGSADVRLEHIIAGTAVDRSVEAEHRAAPGEILVCGDLPAGVAGVDLDVIDDDFARVRGQSPRARAAPLRPLPDPDPTAADTLAAYLHPAVAERIRAGHRRFSNEHRRVTVLFVRFPGFNYALPGVAWELQSLLGPVMRMLARLDGHLYQVDIGDKGTKAIACFGAPVAHEDDEERALRFALEVRRLTPNVRIGAATGAAFFGEIGTPTRREYAAIGDTLNVAARLMQAATSGQILISGASDRSSSSMFKINRLDPIELKGKSGVVPVAEVRELSATERSRMIHADGVTSPMVDRRAEIRRIRRRLRACATGGPGRVLTITGEAGVGKSRVAAEVARLARGLGLGVFTGSCQSQGTRTPYLPWQGLLRGLFGLDPELSPAEQRELLAARLSELDSALAPRTPLLAPALNLPIPDTDLTTGLDPELRHELLAAFVTDVLRRRTLAEPVVLLVEDCHWVDPPSRDLLVAIARDAGRARVVLVMTSRAAEGDEARLGWARSLPDRTDVSLQPLADADVERLARRTLREDFDVADAADEVVGLLTERADGNPFVLEETLHLLRDRGIDPRDPQAVKSSGLPDSVHSLVLARLDTLSSDEYATLKAASVIGRTFDADWLGESFPDLGRAANIASQLNRLHELALIEPEGFRAGNEYRFRHALVRDVAYGTLSISHRQDLHEQVGRMLESTDPEDVDRYVDLLAYHFGASRAVDKQRVYFRKAADAARASFSNEVAITWFERLLPLCDPTEASDVLREAGEVRQLIGDWTGAEGAFHRAIELAERAANPLAVARSQCSLGHLRTYTGSFEEARRLLEAANSTFEQAMDDHGQLRTLEYLAFVAAEGADYESSLAWSQKHLELAQRVGDTIAVCMATEQAGLAQWHRGDYAEAREHLGRALASAEEIGYLRGVILTANDLAGLSAEDGDHVRAFALVGRALEAAHEMGYHHAVGVLVGNAGELYRQHGDIARALTCASKGLTISARLGDRADVATKASNIALALLDHQMDSEVDLFLDAGEDLARATDDRYALCECLQLRAELLTRRGQTEDARKWNEEALAVATEIGRHDVRFAAELLDIRLRFALHEVDGPRATDALGDLDGPSTSERERAAIDYTVWRLTGSEDARNRAAEQFRSLHEMVPNVLYRRRYEELTGDRLPEPKPLPPLPGEDEHALRFVEALTTVQGSLNESRRLIGS